MSELGSILKNTRTHLMNGVSYMIPVVVGGGILMAISVMMKGQGAVPETGISADIWKIGVSGIGLMVPVLSAYIAMSIADRPGIAPGLVGGVLSNSIGAGFLGGIVSGIFAGILCHYLKKIHLPKAIQSIKSIIIIPLLGMFITGGLMLWVIGAPIATIMDHMELFLTNMSGSNKVILGLIVGCMIAFDLGGPVNKVAYGFMVASIGSGIYSYAGPCAIAICVPPIGAGVASLLLKNKFTVEERDAGIGAILMGSVGISEGAISYTANDPVKMIPINMISASAATISAYLMNVTNSAAWGGLIVLPVVNNRVGYVISVAIGIIVYSALCFLLKQDVKHTKEIATPPVEKIIKNSSQKIKILAVTACPSGVAHTYMAAEAIEKACKARNFEIKVETQGAIGIENTINRDDVLSADFVILTKDMPVKNAERFNDIPKIHIAISDAIKKTDEILDDIGKKLNLIK